MLRVLLKKRIAINGCGRIGRLVLKKLLDVPQLEVVAVNDLSAATVIAHLLKYDSVHGKLSQPISVENNHQIRLGKHLISTFRHADPGKLPWREQRIDLVIEASGRFTDSEKASIHLQAGAQKVLVSAPASGDVCTVVLGVNDHVLSAERSTPIFSNASCTTNCLAPLAKVLDDAFGLEKGYITTVHAYTADQRLQDGSHNDLRRARAAALSIVPTSTGAARAVGLVLPSLAGKLNGISMRVPVPNGSLTDLTAVLKKNVSVEEVNQVVKKAAEGALSGILAYTEEPIVSADILGDPHSCIFDAQLTATNGTLAKVVGWYDNETGYSQRIVDLAQRLLDI